MARPREFDGDEVLEKAMHVFWERGLHRTSMRQLEATTGVKQVSLYNAFGDKEGLFLAVLDRYHDRIAAVLDQYLEKRDLDGIAAFAGSIITPRSGFPDNCFGCLMVNTVLVGETGGPAVNARVAACRAMLRAKLAAAINRADARGRLRPELNLDECSELVISAIWGIWVTIRLAADQSAGAPAVNALDRTLRDWVLPEVH